MLFCAAALISCRLSSLFKKIILFIYLTERERAREHKLGLSGAEEQQRELEKRAPHRAGSPLQGSIPGPWDHDLS